MKDNFQVVIKPGKYDTFNKAYPFNLMEVDTMFEIEYSEGLINTLVSRKKTYLKKNPTTEFVIQSSKLKNYIKCWRIK